MKWLRLVFPLAVIVFFCSCESPTIPRYPDAEDDTKEQDPKDPKNQGSVLSVEGIYFA